MQYNQKYFYLNFVLEINLVYKYYLRYGFFKLLRKQIVHTLFLIENIQIILNNLNYTI